MYLSSNKHSPASRYTGSIELYSCARESDMELFQCIIVLIQARSRVLGALDPKFDLMGIVRQELDKVLPPDAHKL